MARPWLLTSFDEDASCPPATDPQEAATAQQDAYEEGYAAALAEAEATRAADRQSAAADLAASLQSMAFSYHEARTAFLAEIEPLIAGILSRIVPEHLGAALGQTVAHLVRTSALDIAPAAEVRVAPENVETVRDMLDTDESLPLKVMGEAGLGDGQAYVRLGDSERQIDLDAALEGIRAVISTYFSTSRGPDTADMIQKDAHHG
ncbi:hypothetical protein RM543_03170 [Roseicyclus sp. F158]|uniref:Flagellar assembly protein FliH n=1 Tax=Tropicimonas omnivorans TaxID=3075590 RepID=A0ABU3DDP5_9RHOB|nr:hypothetical protein [Roseicyclus sp. F158]MDT0681673.1 hypothetical protein [Roseicyclus sp. F158]